MVYMTGGMQTVVQQTPASAQVPVVVAAIGGWRKSGLGAGSSLSTGACPRRAQPSVSVRTEHGGDTECGVRWYYQRPAYWVSAKTFKERLLKLC